MAMKITFHRNPAERTRLEKFLRRFILPPHKPVALPWGRWSVREDRIKRTFPVRFFIWETLPDWFNHSIKRRWKDARLWIRYRTTDKYHVLKMDLKPGYYDPDTRMLQAVFQILQDYVEIELASMHDVVSDGDASESTGNFLKRLGRKIASRRKRNDRNPESGLAYLDWEINETGGNQASDAAEKKELYLWWTQYRPARLNPYDTPMIPLERNGPIFNQPPGTNREAYKLIHNLENLYHAEDENMLIRLMKIRSSLWT